MADGTIRIGIGGWTYGPWRGSFFPDDLPQRRELEFASRRLTTIEVNGTFYRTQKPETFRNWHDETPEGFVLALKAPRYATNRRELAGAGDSIARFMESGLDRLGDKLGPINWQFPPTKKFEPGDFAAFLALLPPDLDGRKLRHAVEVRHDSFLVPEFPALLRKHGVAAVVSDGGGYPQIADPTANFTYARIMGTHEDQPEGYAPDALDLWAARARDWAAGRVPEGLNQLGPAGEATPREVFLYVISGHKARNPQAAMALIRRLSP